MISEDEHMTLHRSYRGILVALTLLSGTLVAPIHAQKGGQSPAQGQSQGQAGGGTGTPFFETQMLAYGGVNQLSEAVAQQVCKMDLSTTNPPDTTPVKPTIVIFDQTSFQNLQAWESFSVTSTMLKSAYMTLLTPDQQDAALPPKEQNFAGFFLGGADLGALITAVASSSTNTASTFTIQDSTMAVSLAHQFLSILDCKQVNLVYFPLFGSYVNLNDAKQHLLDEIGDLNQVRTYIQLNFPFSGNNDPNFLLFSDLNSEYDLLMKSIASGSSQSPGGQQNGGQPPPPGGGMQTSAALGVSPNSGSPNSGAQGVTSLIQGAALNDLLNQNSTYVLYADVVAAGGTQRDIKNVLTLITGDWIQYSGGLIVNVALVHSKDTNLEFADTLRYRTGTARISNPRESPHVENVNSGENESSVCNGEKRLPWYVGEKHAPDPCPRVEASNAKPSPTEAPTPPPLSLTFDPPEIGGGGSTKMYIELTQNAPEGGVIVNLGSSNPSVHVPPSVSVEEGKQDPGGSVIVNTPTVGGQTLVKVTATYTRKVEPSGGDKNDGKSATKTLTINEALSLKRTTFQSGLKGNGTITLPDMTTIARTIHLSATNAALISFDQDTAVVQPDENTASFAFTATNGGNTQAQATIEATLNNVVIGRATVTVNPSAPPAH
jgi:hypothetical protein